MRPAEPPSPVTIAFQGALEQGGLAIGTAPAGTVAVTLDGMPVTLAPGGRFLIGFGRDAAPGARVEARLASGRILRDDIAVAQRTYKVESIPGLKQSSTPNPDYERLRAAEVARIKAARATEVDSGGWQQRFLWPVTGRISGVYGSQRILGGKPMDPHFGVDIARPEGTPVIAPADGVVTLAAPPKFSLEGNLLIIAHGMGLSTAYLHLSRIDVRVGDHVTRGQLVGAIGTTGRSTGPHLHWAMNWKTVRVDPQLMAGPMPGTAVR